MKKKYPWFDIYWDENDVEAVNEVIRRGSYWAAGPEIRQFEKKLEDFFEVEHVLTFNSGTSALHSLLIAYEITSGEVIVPSFSFISTVNCVVLAGARPVFADIEKESFGLDYREVQKKINSKTKAILPMHYAGKICRDITKLKKIAEKENILLIEDNAESFGATYNGKLAGTFGDSSMLSFCQNKVLTTGEGGAALTNKTEIYEKLKLLRSHGRVEDKDTNYFESIDFMDYVDIGYNYRLPTMSAALGISQFKKIDKMIKIRRNVGKYYDKMLKKIPQVEIIEDYPGVKSVYQFYAFLVKEKRHRDPLREHLKEKNIFTKVQFQPIHQKTSFKNRFDVKKEDLDNTENISNRVISLPFSLNFSKLDQNSIVDCIKDFFIETEN